jgi:hypothetical protein
MQSLKFVRQNKKRINMDKKIIVGAALLVAGAVQAAVVVGLDFVDTANSGAVTSLGTGTVTLSTASTDNTLVMGTVVSAAQQLGAVTLTDGGFSGVYHLSVDIASTGTGDTDVGRGGSGTLSSGGNLLSAGEALTFSNVQLSYVSGDDVFQFDGFTGVRIGNLSGDEACTANEITIVEGNAGEGSGSSFTPTAAFNLASTAVITSTVGTGGISINVVDAQFSAIPEPATLGLLSVFGGGLLFFRRRFMM